MPGWYALATAALVENGVWQQSKLLTPTEPRKDASSPVMTEDGGTVIYAWDGKLFEWNEGADVKPIPVEMPEFRLEPRSVTPDGSKLLFSAGKGDGKGGWITLTYLTKRSHEGWQTPQLILSDVNFSIWQPLLTAAGDAIIFRKVDNPKEKEVRRETLQRILLRNGEPAQAEVLLELPVHSDCQSLALSDTGQMVYSVQTQSDPLTYEVFYVRTLKPGANSTNLSSVLKRALGRKEAPKGTTDTRDNERD